MKKLLVFVTLVLALPQAYAATTTYYNPKTQKRTAQQRTHAQRIQSQPRSSAQQRTSEQKRYGTREKQQQYKETRSTKKIRI